MIYYTTQGLFRLIKGTSTVDVSVVPDLGIKIQFG